MTRIGLCTVVVLGMLMTVGTTSALAGPLYDQDVTNNAIFGSGNTNGSWTVERANGVELGLRGKLRHNAAGAPENTFNSNGDGTYSFAAGVAPTQSFPTAEWSFEWSINSDWDDSSGFVLEELTYVLAWDSDPTADTSFGGGDFINVTWADHSIGTNGTGEGLGDEAPLNDDTAYADLISQNNLAQNSWKPSWFLTGFDPTVDGTYDFVLSAYTPAGALLASTEMQIIVGTGNPVPEPMTLTLLGLGLGGLAVVRRRRS